MQKAYSRINWKNEPSLDTPLGANNLNKMDSALDVIDNRVLSLSGYEGRVQASEKNAKASEVNAKTSENNAKESEELAKQYMENAFSGTPEGYDKLVEDVRLMDIKTTTDTTLLNSKSGGYKLLSMSGNSVQKTYTGKNFMLNDGTTKTINGVTFTVNNDKSVTCNGTATADAIFHCSSIGITLQAGNYLLSGCPKGGGESTYDLRMTSTYKDYGTGRSVNITEETLLGCTIVIRSGQTVSNLTFYPMLRLATETDATYEPYVGGIPSPNPDYPQSINNVGDCVEMMQGLWSASGYTNNALRICSRNSVPCASGDVIAIKCEVPIIAIFAYDSANNILGTYASENSEYELQATMPSGAHHFKINLGDNNGLTPDTVGKISLTINGKYVVQIVENWKNFLDTRGWESLLHQGVTYTPVYDSNGGLLYINANGTATATSMLQIKNLSLKKGTYILSGCPSGGGNSSYMLYLSDSNGTPIGNDVGNGVTITLTEDTTGLIVRHRVQSGYNANNLKFYPMIRKADITDATYEPYKEKVATVLLNAPLRDTDVMSRTEVVRKRGTVVLNGSENWMYWGTEGDNYGVTLDNAFTYNNAFSNTTNALSNRFVPRSGGRLPEECLGLRQNGDTQYRVYLCLATSRLSEASVNGVKEWLAENPITLEYELKTPIVETLDTTSQIALNSLETFNSVTYINVDSRTQPKGIKGEYGTSKVGARTIKNELKNDTLEIKYNELVSTLLANNEVAEVEEVLEGDEE